MVKNKFVRRAFFPLFLLMAITLMGLVGVEGCVFSKEPPQSKRLPEMKAVDVQAFILAWRSAMGQRDTQAMISLVAPDFRTDDGKNYSEFVSILNRAVPQGLTFDMSVGGFYRDGSVAAVYPVQVRFPDGNEGKLVFFLRKKPNDIALLFELHGYRGYFEQPPAGKELSRTKINHKDISKINTTGFEAEPTVTGDGRVLYFQCSPRHFFDPTAECTGPDRPGMSCAEMGNYSDPSVRKVKGIRTFRTEWNGKHWTTPEAQIPSNLPDNTWLLVIIGISSDDQHALLIVHPKRGDSSDTYIMHRQEDGNWGLAEPIDEINHSGADEDAQFLVGSATEFYFMSNRPGGQGGADIWRYNTKTQSRTNVGPPVNTAAGEWFPKPDAKGNLYFTRDGLYVYDGKAVSKLSLGGRTDCQAIGGSVTADGSLIFYRMRVRPQPGSRDGDWDIFFSRRLGNDPAVWSKPIPVDRRQTGLSDLVARRTSSWKKSGEE